MPMTDKEIRIFKKWLRSHLKFGPTNLVFLKKDGTLRNMKCTLNPTLIMFIDPSYVEHVAVNTPESDTNIRVFDLENKGWRSFRWDSVKEVRFTL
jgi:hypothetical protein